MQREKPIKETVSFELAPGRDDDLREYLNRPEVNKSAACREGLRLLIRQAQGQQNMVGMVEELLSLVKNGTVIPSPEKKSYNDPFLDQSL